jgi:hypothetical protein
MIVRNGGSVCDDMVMIKLQRPETVPLEVSFPGLYPVSRVVPVREGNEISFEFEGTGFAVAAPPNGKDYGERNHIFEAEVYIDGNLTEKVLLPTEENRRRFTPFWNYQLPRANHRVVIRILNPVDYAEVRYNYAVIYDDKPYQIKW